MVHLGRLNFSSTLVEMSASKCAKYISRDSNTPLLPQAPGTY